MNTLFELCDRKGHVSINYVPLKRAKQSLHKNISVSGLCQGPSLPKYIFILNKTFFFLQLFLSKLFRYVQSTVSQPVIHTVSQNLKVYNFFGYFSEIFGRLCDMLISLRCPLKVFLRYFEEPTF